MYRLIVKKNNEWLNVNLGDDKPAINFETNNINELKNRNANWSQKLSLPLTDNNCRIFEMVHLFDVVSDIPYRRHECRLYHNDTEIAGRGSVLSIITVHERVIDCQILSGIVDLFDLLKNTKMEDNKWGDFVFRYTSFYAPHYSSLVEIALATFVVDGGALGNQHIGNSMPFMFFLEGIDRILFKYGYTMNCKRRDELKDVVLPCVVPPEIKDIAELGWNPNLDGASLNPGSVSGLHIIFPDILNNAHGTLYFLYTKDILYYNPPVSGNIDIHFKADRTLDFLNRSVKLIIKKNGNILDSVDNAFPELNVNTSISPSDLFTFEVLTGDNWGDNITLIGITLNITLNIDVNLQPFLLQTIPIAASLGFNTEFDFLQAFIQAFGMFVDIDVINKILHCYTFDEITENKLPVLDWTDKVDMQAIEWDFHNIDFARNNYLAMQDNDKDMITDSSDFTINDEVLQFEKEFLKLPFEAGMDSMALLGGQSVKIANIPIITYEVQEDNSLKTSVKETKPHLCRLSDNYYSHNFEGNGSNYKTTRHIPTSELLQYYSAFIETLNEYKYITLKMHLTEYDIENYNQLRPVYLEQFGRFFYINKIRNFTAGKLTQVELLKI
ncbi:MAG: hypothetical protein FWD66_01085 [Paludibacter sp.]|nr:hypothetical protein [Paludibacter sp.]